MAHSNKIADIISEHGEQFAGDPIFESNRKDIQNQYENLLESLPVITYIVEAKPPYAPIYVSANIRMLGYTQEDWFKIQGLWINLIHEDDREHILAETKSAMHEERETKYEYRMRARDGKIYWFYDRGRFAKNNAGEIISWEGVLLDITERKNAELKLIKSESNYRLLIEQASDAIFIIDRKGSLLEVNSKACEMLKCQDEDILGNDIRESFLASDLEKSPLRFKDLLAGKSIMSERQMLCGDSTLVQVEISAKMLDDERILGIVRDISARKRMEESLRLLESAVYQAKDTVLITTAELDAPGPQIVFANPAFTEMTGYSVEEVIGQTPRILQGARTDRQVLKKLHRDLLKGIEFRGEAINYRKDGSEYWVEWNVTPLRDAGGVTTHYLAVQQDITSRKSLEEQLRQSQKMEAVGRLAGGIAHDFNNLLTVIMGYSDLSLRRLSDAEPARRNIEEIKRAGERASELTKQLLAFSRKQILQTRVLNLNTVISEMERMLHRLIPEHIELEMDLKPLLGNVKADVGQVEQVVMNLVVNACDAMPNGGKLIVRTQNFQLPGKNDSLPDGNSKKYILLTVADTGIGMDAELQKQIFEPFFTTKEKDKGTGLGLATAYGIVTQSAGYIKVDSEVGRGSTLSVYLPLVSEIEPDKFPKSSDANVSASGKTILLVEDEEIVLNLIRQILISRGHKVLNASGGTEALKICREHQEPIDLLITDVVMPKMNGRELAEQIARLRPQTKVLYMSGYTDDTILRHGISATDAHFVQKPFDPESLANKISEVINAD